MNILLLIKMITYARVAVFIKIFIWLNLSTSNQTFTEIGNNWIYNRLYRELVDCVWQALDM
jgi:hypothetical protein